jgi:eukaryotic-like serine/threonine-protein kinase
VSVRRRAEQIFEAALDVRPEERAALVVAAAAGDAEVLNAAQALLAAHERTGILDLHPRSLLELSDPMPERLGVYSVLREIGCGGMGVVYEAERDDGQFRRRVAIKVLRAGDDLELRQRVVAERQILAALDHPGIARLLDGGVTADGRPYLVMELIEGLPLDVFCDRMGLTVPERLRLFVDVTRAVAYAHRNLIVHRDLKPSNILVTTDGQVKLLDFGVAKLLNPALGAVAAQTLHGLALTPEYASPEQLRGEALTTQSDLFALGVLLYELLTARRPFAALGLGPLARAIAEEEPPPPSERVLRRETVPQRGGATTLEPEAVARSRQLTPARLSRLLAGDPDAIVATALRKEPQRRYGSAELLAQDVERFLEGRPILAQRRGPLYTFSKFVRRHWVPAGAIALATISLLAGSATALWQAGAAREQRDSAVANGAKAAQITEFMVDLFSSGAPGGAVQGQVSARDLVRRGTARIDGLARQPLVQANLLEALGRAYEGLGDYEEGQRLTQRALDSHLAQPRRDNLAVAAVLLQLGTLQRRRSRYDSAQASFFAALAEVPHAAAAPALLGGILLNVQGIAIYRGELIEAERRAGEAVERLRRELGETHPVTIDALSQLASAQWRRGKLESEALYRRVIELRQRVPNHTPAELMTDRMALANMLLTERLRLDEAEATFRSVIVATPDVPERLNLGVWARANLALLHEERGEFAAAERLLRDNVELRRQLHGDEHPDVARSFAAVARTLMTRGRFDEAQQYYDSAGVIVRATFGDRDAVLVGWLTAVAQLHHARGDLHSADTLLTHAVALQDQIAHGFQPALLVHAEVMIGLGEYARAEAMLNQALGSVRGQVVDGARVIRRIHAVFAKLYDASGRPQDAARHLALSLPLPIVQ